MSEVEPPLESVVFYCTCGRGLMLDDPTCPDCGAEWRRRAYSAWLQQEVGDG